MQIPFKVPIAIECQRLLRTDSNLYNVNFSCVDFIIDHRAYSKISSHHMCSTPSQIICSIITEKFASKSTYVCASRKLSQRNPKRKKKEKCSAVPYTVSDKCVFYFYQSRPFMNIRLGNGFSSLLKMYLFFKSVFEFSADLDGSKVYKYPDRKVERDSSKFWFCGVQTVLLNKTIQNVWRWCLCVSCWQWFVNDIKNMDYSIRTWIIVFRGVKKWKKDNFDERNVWKLFFCVLKK